MSRFSSLLTSLNNQENLKYSSKLFNYVSKFKKNLKNMEKLLFNLLPNHSSCPMKLLSSHRSNLLMIENCNHNFKMKLIKNNVTNLKSNFLYGLSRKNF